MNQKRRNGSRVIAALLLLAIVQVGLQVGLAEPNNTTNPVAVPQQVVARSDDAEQPADSRLMV